jgi:VIT1/CCC1 family predicted Fe2+/Mn2+ transporter
MDCPQFDKIDQHLKPVIQADQGEMHRSRRAGWLRAAVLGSDDAIVSTASLMIGVAAASASKGAILVAGVAGLVAGAMSMAVGEYVSVSSQRDSEQADIGRETRELTAQPEAELQELAMIYVKRGLERDLAMEVAEQLTAHDRLGAHMRDELGIDQTSLSRPMQAAWISAASFAFFAVIPDHRSSRCAAVPAHSRDRSGLSRQPGSSRCVRRLSWRCPVGPCVATRNARRRFGNGSDRSHRSDSWRFCDVRLSCFRRHHASPFDPTKVWSMD